MPAQTSDIQVNGKPVYVGPAGWAYEDSKGIVYPEKPAKFDVLAYVSRFYNTVEVNVSFYRFVPPRMSESWAGRIADPDRFLFTYKLNQRFTHQRDNAYSPAEAREFKEGLEPVVRAGMFGALLAQFPWSFRFGDEAKRTLERIQGDFGEYPLAVEVRHRSWEHPEALGWLRDRRLSVCSIDQPFISSNMRPLDVTTGPLAYVRLHGRNAAKWFANDIQPWERYDYTYTEDQLEQWSQRVKDLTRDTERTFVIANNHYKGQGAANALQLRHMLTDQPVEVPPTMVQHYPQLAGIAAPARSAHTDAAPGPQAQQRQLF